MEVAEAVVAGAGPAGCAAALALARRGTHVTLVEPRPERGGRVAGEWLHPAGVAALARLGVSLPSGAFVEKRGFLVHPGAGDTPIELPYGRGGAVTAPHHVFAGALLAQARRTGSVTVVFGPRLTDATADGACRVAGELLHVPLVVGADGRNSAVRRALYRNAAPPVTLSHTAGLVLRDVPLPTEGYGHIFLGGPGPALVYRIAPALVRVCLDVPLSRPGAGQVRAYLEGRFTGYLPAELAEAFRRGVRAGDVQWSVGQFRRRACFGRGRVVLVGDAAGCGHPLAAQGMTNAVLDAEGLAAATDLEGYRKARTQASRVPERVAAAVHRVLTGHDRASLALRHSLFALWRGDAHERARSMRLLALEETRRGALGGSVAHIAAGALAYAVRDERRDLLDSVATVTGLANWLLWLAGSHVGVPPRRRVRKVAVMGC
ncbi:FAD-dependent monooxygenase [Streptomyces sp. CC224B]|uniref:FAD-dependent monooxygenase n=1 Tax=Streptomyces sp. CC224B TaxID=3044571 RepID=UPI0024A8DE36|nr:FAD-dependent monooxygenase [Streptomyces sp. CC224B]